MTRPKNPQKCAKPSCTRREENHGYCRKHMRLHAAVGYVDAAIVYGHIDALRERGWSVHQIAEHVGCHFSAIVRRKNKRFQAELANRILAIPLPKEAWKPDSKSLVSAVGTRRRIQALQFMGYTRSQIGEAAGVSRQQIAYWASQRSVTGVTAQTIHEVFERMAMTAGPSARVKAMAARKGWRSVLDWDDIDDPDETPDTTPGGYVSFMERYEDAISIGIPLVELPKRLGLLPDSLAASMRRHGIAVPNELYSLCAARRKTA